MREEFDKMIAEYEQKIQDPATNGIRADRQIPMDDMIKLDSWFASREVDPGEEFWKAADREHPDYSHFEEFPNLLKDYLAEKKMKEFSETTNGSFSTENPTVQENLKKYSSDPAFRRGLGMEKTGDEIPPEQKKACISYMDQYEADKKKNAPAKPKTPQEELDSMMAQYRKDAMGPGGKGVIPNHRLTVEATVKLKELLSNPDVNPGEAFKMATDPQHPDYSKFGDIPIMLKDYLAETKLQEFMFATKGNFDTKDPVVRKNLEKFSMDPAFRTAVNMGKIRKGEAKDMKACDAYMNMYVMEQTMKPVSARQAQNVQAAMKMNQKIADDLLKMNENNQVFLAKMMFLSQLGRFDQKERDGVVKPYENTITEAFSHGGRTGFILPPGKGQTKLFNSLMGEDYYNQSGIKGRFAATHTVVQQTYNKDGSIATRFQEKKSIGSPFSQYGMNLAVGGMGNIGPNRKPIMNQGVDGHMYMNIKKGGEQKSGSLLVGMENEGPGMTGRLGHAHTAAAVKSDQSVFMSDKQGYGKEVDGRTVDLSHMKPEDLTNMLNDFERGYRSMMEQAKRNLDAMQELLDLNRKLCGQYMKPKDLANVMTSVGIRKNEAVAAVNNARSYEKGHYNDKVHEKAYEPVKQSQVREETRRDPVEIPPKPKFRNRVGAFFRMKKHMDICRAYDDYVKNGVTSQVREPNEREMQEMSDKRLENINSRSKQEKVQENTKNKGIRITMDDLDVKNESKLKLPKEPQRERSRSVYQKKSPYLNGPGK